MADAIPTRKLGSRALFVIVAFLLSAEKLQCNRVKMHSFEREAGDLVWQNPSSAAVVDNTDRFQCKRQDYFDIAVPPTPGMVLRLPFGWGGTVENDIYVSADYLFIESLTARIKMYRTGRTRFAFEILGWGGTDNAHARFQLGGVQIFSRSTLVNVGKSIINKLGVADLNQLKNKQPGTLALSLLGEAEAQQNEKTGAWEMKLVRQEKRHFNFKIASQGVIQSLLNSDRGGVDKMIIEGLWSGISTWLLPPALATAFSALPLTEADTSILLDVKGTMEKEGAPMHVDANLILTFDVMPAKIFEYWKSNFNLEQLAVEKVDNFLDQKEVQDAWINNRQAFADNLKRYGFGLLLDRLEKEKEQKDKENQEKDGATVAEVGEEAEVATVAEVAAKAADDTDEESREKQKRILEIVMKDGTLDELRPFLHEIAKNTASMVLRFFEPFTQAWEKGSKGLFTGLGASSTVTANFGHPDKRITGGATNKPLHDLSRTWKMGTPEKNAGADHSSAAQLTLPRELLGIFGFDQILAFPKASQSHSSLETDLKLAGRNLKISRVQMQDLRVRMEGAASNDTTPATPAFKRTLKLNGKASDFSLTMPRALDSGWDVTCSKASIDVIPNGVAIDLKEGFKFQSPIFTGDRPPPAELSAAEHVRVADDDKIDGLLPPTMKPPLRDPAPPTMEDYTPQWEATVTTTLTGTEHKVSNTIVFDGNLDLGLLPMLRELMTARETKDFGYPFGAAMVHRYTHGSNSLKNDIPIQCLAVVSCGFLTLFEPEVLEQQDFWARLNFHPPDGQLELDITKYTGYPDEVLRDGGERCIDLTSMGQQPWHEKNWLQQHYTVTERICAVPDELEKILKPLKLQIDRFKDPRATKWNYGTHDANKDDQFVLGGRETRPLLEFLMERLPPSSG